MSDQALSGLLLFHYQILSFIYKHTVKPLVQYGSLQSGAGQSASQGAMQLAQAIMGKNKFYEIADT